jgi:hypothetical protein
MLLSAANAIDVIVSKIINKNFNDFIIIAPLVF